MREKRPLLSPILVVMLIATATEIGAQISASHPKLERLALQPSVPVQTEWEELPRVRVGVMRSAGEIHVRVGKITAGSDHAEGLEVTIVLDDFTATTYIDPEEIQPLIEALDAALQMPMKPEKKQIVREIAYETKGRFRVVANQTGGDEPDYRFMIFIPVGLTGLPKLPAEFRADGPAGVLVPHVLRGDPNDAHHLRDTLDTARKKLSGAV
jgi:hypothetical protein